MNKMTTGWQNITAKIEPWWTLVGAPVVQEFIFRFAPYQFFLIYGGFYTIGIVSSILFAAIHWYFEKWFVLYTLIGGVILWIVMVHYGFLWVVILHGVANVILLKLGVLQKVKGKLI